MLDRNSEEFELLIEIPLSQLFSLKGALGSYKAAGAGAVKAVASPTGLAVAAGAAAAIYAGYKIYKDYISKAGVACKNKPNRRRCELLFHLKGKKAQLEKMLNGMHNCKNHECYQKLDKKVNQTKREIDNLAKKISKIPELKEPERTEDEIFKGKSETSK